MEVSFKTKGERASFLMINIIELKNRALNSQLVNDSFWALFGNVVAKGLALSAGIIVARFLGKDIYGEYGIILNALMSIAIFSTFGLGYTATKFVAENKKNNPEYIGAILRYSRNITLTLSGVMAIGLFFSSSYIAFSVFEAPHLANSLRLVAVWIIFNAVTTTQVGVLSGFGDFKGMARVNTIVGISTFIFSIILTYYWLLNGALIAFLFTQILNWWLNFRLVNRNLSGLKNSTALEKPLLKEILKFSFPVALQEALYSLTSWFTVLLLVKLSTYGELGLYSAAMQWNAIILFIPGILRNVILSHLSEANNNEQRFNRVLKITLLFNFIMTFIPFLFVLTFSSLISNFYGSSFSGLTKLINASIFSTIISSIMNVYSQSYMSKGKNWLMFFMRIFRDSFIVLSLYYLLSNTNELSASLLLVYSSLAINTLFLILIIFVYHLKIK